MPTSPTRPSLPASPSPTAQARVGTALGVAMFSGAVVALQGKVNGDLSTAGAGALVASWVSYAGTLLTVLVVLAVMGQLPGALSLIRSKGGLWWFAIGLCAVPLVIAMAVGIPVIGVALASVCSVAGQTVSGLVLDSRGIGVEAPLRMTVRRAVAGLGAIVGLVVAVLSGSGPESGTTGAAVLIGVSIFVGGLLLAVQQAGNGAVAEVSGSPLVPTLTSVIGGLVGVTVITGLWAVSGHLGEVALPRGDQWWLYLGGPLGMVITAAAAFAVHRLGTFALTIAIVSGQLAMAVVLDVTSGVGAGWPTAASLAIIAVSVALTVVPAKPDRASAPTTGPGSPASSDSADAERSPQR